MTHLKKLEEVLDLLINEEHDRAADILHDIVVEKARQIYEELLDGEEGMEEDFGGDMDTDYSAEIEQDKGDIESDEMFSDADDSVEDAGFEGEEVDVEDRIGELESQIAELEAKFAELSGEEESEEGEEATDDFGDFEDEGEASEEGFEDEGEEGDQFESLEEATKLSSDVSIDMSKEGKYAGTGAKSASASVNTKSPIARKPTNNIADVKPIKVNSGKTGDTKPTAARKDDGFGAKHNMNTALKSQSVDMKGEGKPVGTGKNTPKGAVAAKSPLAKK